MSFNCSAKSRTFTEFLLVLPALREPHNFSTTQDRTAPLESKKSAPIWKPRSDKCTCIGSREEYAYITQVPYNFEVLVLEYFFIPLSVLY